MLEWTRERVLLFNQMLSISRNEGKTIPEFIHSRAGWNMGTGGFMNMWYEQYANTVYGEGKNHPLVKNLETEMIF